MKSIKNVKEKITDFENLMQAYKMARKNKRYRGEVLKFSLNLEENLHKIQQELQNQTYKGGHYNEKIIRDPVERLIMWQAFRHRVVQWAAYRVINPEFVRGYIKDSYACIEGRGADAAAERLFEFLQKGRRLEQMSPGRKFYFLKIDTSKFFYRIDHEIAMNLIGRKVNFDPWTMWLFDIFINSKHAAFGLPPGKSASEVRPEERLYDKGLAVGNLINQMMANVTQNEVDKFCKRVIGIKYYVRYMDDIVIVGDSKPQLHAWREQIETFMRERLKLDLNPKKTFIRPINLGIEFCQYKIFPTHKKLKKSTALRMKRRLKFIQEKYAAGEITLDRANKTVQSYIGMMSHCNSYLLRRKIFGDPEGEEKGWFVLQRDNNEKG